MSLSRELRKVARNLQGKSVDAEMLQDLQDANKQVKNFQKIVEQGLKRELPGSEEGKKALEELMKSLKEMQKGL